MITKQEELDVKVMREVLFYGSLEDLMRISDQNYEYYASKLGLKDGELTPWINKALERHNKSRVRNLDIRKTLIKFDNVLNDQRHVIFTQRKDVKKVRKFLNTQIIS